MGANGIVATVSTQQWHRLSVTHTLAELRTDFGKGLSQEEAKKRCQEYGPNELVAKGGVSKWVLFLEQFKDILIGILIAGAILSGILGHTVEAVAIIVIVLFAVILGFVQEYRAERAMEALKKMAAPLATVIRLGKEQEIPARDLVPGDIILLTTGDRVPGDARLLDAVNLQTDEGALTGESHPLEKSSDMLREQDIPIGDRRNIVYAGTSVTYGRGKAVIIATGMKTEFGKIAGLLQGVESVETPLQKNLDKVGKSLAKAAGIVVVIIVGMGLFRGQPFLEMLIFGVALAVAVVPEALPAVVTISLAIGVQRMVKRHALIRRLPAVETLGSTTVICSDKTGTLTKDEMTVRKIFCSDREIDVTGVGYEPKGELTESGQKIELDSALRELFQGAVLCSDAKLIEDDGRWEIKGDPTEGGLIVAAAKAGFRKDDLEREFPRSDEIPFSSETKRMTTFHHGKDGIVAYAKGAPEMLLQACTGVYTAGGEEPMRDDRRREILMKAQQFAEHALRVLAVARKTAATKANAETHMIFLGLLGMIDPPRPEVKEAVVICKKAGIKAIMITGDHPVTAKAIAKELGILTDGKEVTGMELDGISDEDFKEEVERIQVYARVSPAHKLRIVTALQKNGEVVAMTGDGVNDAPALKKADIGIAMGITGTDVTKEAADMTLTDDNFASIVAAVEEGRGIFGNVKKYLMYLLSSNIGEIFIMAGASLAGFPLPLSAVQLLYVNLATDGLPALALAVDPPERDLMSRPPRDPRIGIFTKPVVMLMLFGGIWSAIVNLSLFSWALRSGKSASEAMTLIFVLLVVIEFFKAFNFRSDRNTAFARPFANRWLNIAILWELMLLLCVIYVPFLQVPFGTFALSWQEWLLLLVIGSSVTPVLEIGKVCIRRGWWGR